MIRNLLTYIVPRIVYETGSSYNRHIRVLMVAGKYKLLANGARESGEYIEKLWRYAMGSLDLRKNPQPKKILVLGVAGGTAIHLLHGLYPRAAITGVDIDEKMIHIGKTYFGLKDVRALTCVCDDARHFIRNTDERFGLIVVDLFIGPDVPEFVGDLGFVRNIQKLLTPNGSVFINYLREPGYEKKAASLEASLRRLFCSVRSADCYNNRFFLASGDSGIVVK